MKNLRCFVLLVSCLISEVTAVKGDVSTGNGSRQGNKKEKCFEKPNKELQEKLAECIKESRIEMENLNLKIVAYNVPPRIQIVKSCYFKKLGLVSNDYKEFNVDKLGKVIEMFELPKKRKEEILTSVEECKDSDVEEGVLNVEEDILKIPGVTEEIKSKIFPEACKKAAEVMTCIKNKIHEICSEFKGLASSEAEAAASAVPDIVNGNSDMIGR